MFKYIPRNIELSFDDVNLIMEAVKQIQSCITQKQLPLNFNKVYGFFILSPGEVVPVRFPGYQESGGTLHSTPFAFPYLKGFQESLFQDLVEVMGKLPKSQTQVEFAVVTDNGILVPITTLRVPYLDLGKTEKKVYQFSSKKDKKELVSWLVSHFDDIDMDFVHSVKIEKSTSVDTLKVVKSYELVKQINGTNVGEKLSKDDLITMFNDFINTTGKSTDKAVEFNMIITYGVKESKHMPLDEVIEPFVIDFSNSKYY